MYLSPVSDHTSVHVRFYYQMESFNDGACRNQLWCVIFASFVFSFSLFYFDSLTLIGSDNVLQSTNDYIHSILNLLPKPNSLLMSKNGNEPVVQNPVFDNVVNQFDDQISVRVNASNEKGHVNKSDVTKNETDKNRVEFVDRVISNEKELELDPCSGKYIYAYDLPSKFNSDLLKECRTLCSWMDMCHYLSNEGLGPKLDNKHGVLTDKGWFMTDQFALDVIFHNRMKQYKCLTKNSSLASAMYVPFYAGLEAGRYLWGFNTSVRDYTSHDLIQWISNRPEWQVLGGRNHFMVAGRITWDFRRARDIDSDWGNSLMFMPESKNMTILVIESSPWHSNDFAIPYPSYFHPSTDNEVLQWQKKMRKQKKKYLFCFAGAPRPKLVDSIRSQIIEQCEATKGKCKLLECHKGTDKCHSPVDVMKMFQNSVFCLQPPGDSYTRKSAFDSILAGCIPVFFHPGSAYIQYTWHLPQNYTKYSVFLPVDDVRSGKLNMESTLSQIPDKDVKAMRKEIIRLIPKLLYADPRSRLETVEDAFDVAVQGVIQRVTEIRREIKEGSRDVRYSEVNSWKSSLAGTAEELEWEHYFSKTKM